MDKKRGKKAKKMNQSRNGNSQGGYKQKDISEKYLEDYSDVFADIINVLIFDGNRRVWPEDLSSMNGRSRYKADDSRLHEQERDSVKQWKKGRVCFATFGIENQTRYDSDMPLRVISYDGSNYRSQLLKDRREDFPKGTDSTKQTDSPKETDHMRYPVITIVLNFGMERWNSNRKLSDCFPLTDEMKPYFSDYSINVIDVAFLVDEQIEKFTSDFKIVADFFVKKRKFGDVFTPIDKEIEHVDAVLKLLHVMTNDDRYNEPMIRKKVREERKMCTVLDYRENKGRAEGRIEGRAEDIITLLQEKGHVTKNLIQLITSQKDIEVLSQWFKLAIRTSTVEEFLNGI